MLSNTLGADACLALRDVIGNNHEEVLWRWEGGVGVEGGRGMSKNRTATMNEKFWDRHKDRYGSVCLLVSYANEGKTWQPNFM